MTQQLKRVLRLMDNSPVHKDWPLQGKIQCALLPLIHDQCILNSDGFLSWAWLSDDAEGRFIAKGHIEPNDWKSGDNLWFADLIGNAPRLVRAAQRERFATYRGTGKWRRGFGTGHTVKFGTVRQ